MIFTVVILFGCSKKENDANLFIYQSGEDVNTSIPLAYDIFPTSKQLKVIWNEGSDSYYTDLLKFEASNDSIKLSYQDKDEKDKTKIFEIISNSTVQDETEVKYEWFGRNN